MNHRAQKVFSRPGCPHRRLNRYRQCWVPQAEGLVDRGGSAWSDDPYGAPQLYLLRDPRLEVRTCKPLLGVGLGMAAKLRS